MQTKMYTVEQKDKDVFFSQLLLSLSQQLLLSLPPSHSLFILSAKVFWGEGKLCIRHRQTQIDHAVR